MEGALPTEAIKGVARKVYDRAKVRRRDLDTEHRAGAVDQFALKHREIERQFDRRSAFDIP